MFKLYRKYLKYYKKEVILGPLFKLLEAVFELFVPLVIASMINKGFMQSDFNYCLRMFIILIVLAITGLTSTLICQYFASKASQGFGTRLRNDVYTKATLLNKENFDYFKVPRLASIINNDIKNLEYSVAMLIRLVIRAPFIVIGSVIMSFIVNVYFGLIVLISSVILLSVILFIMLRTIPYNKSSLKELDNVSMLFKEDIGGSYLIRTNASYKIHQDKTDKALDKLYTKNKSVSFLQAILSPSSILIINITMAIGVVISYFLIENNSILPGDILALISYLNQILIASQVVCNLIITFGKAISSASRVNELLDYNNIINFNKEEVLNDNDSVIDVNNLCYRFYKDSDLVLKNISFKVKQDEFITLVGTTGSGKTTLLNILANMLTKDDGSVYILGKNQESYNKDDYYNIISYALQKNMLINDTIYNNIIFGSINDINEDYLIASCVDEVINKKSDNINEQILDRGTNLSGGEKKRVLLARALHRDSKILLLDQTLAGLDNLTTKKVLNNLKNLKVTTILVTDNRNILRQSDRILLLDNGELVGFDTYDNLLSNNDLFKDLIGDYHE